MGQIEEHMRKASQADVNAIFSMLKRFAGVEEKSAEIILTRETVANRVEEMFLCYVIESKKGKIVGLLVPKKVYKDGEVHDEKEMQAAKRKSDSEVHKRFEDTLEDLGWL